MFHFRRGHLILLCFGLLALGGGATYLALTLNLKGVAFQPSALPIQKPAAGTPPWGELITFEIEVERPKEFVVQEVQTNLSLWTFANQTPDQVKATLSQCGFTPAQVESVFVPARYRATPTNTVINPSDDLLFALAPDCRSKLYDHLAKSHNLYMEFPFCFRAQVFDTVFNGSNIDPAVVSMIHGLLYPRGTAECLSDLELVLRHLKSADERLQVLQVLSRQSAILARVIIKPDTDIDLLMEYWGRGRRSVELRILLESIKRRPDGGNASLLYFLPPFARDRLYNYPDPAELQRRPRMDCHWSSFNFFNTTPDDSFADSAYISKYVRENYYQVAKCGKYGDIVMLTRGDNQVVHSAVYLADDIVFTKNGFSKAQPWILMHLKDMIAAFPSNQPLRIEVYRNKNL